MKLIKKCTNYLQNNRRGGVVVIEFIYVCVSSRFPFVFTHCEMRTLYINNITTWNVQFVLKFYVTIKINHARYQGTQHLIPKELDAFNAKLLQTFVAFVSVSSDCGWIWQWFRKFDVSSWKSPVHTQVDLAGFRIITITSRYSARRVCYCKRISVNTESELWYDVEYFDLSIDNKSERFGFIGFSRFIKPHCLINLIPLNVKNNLCLHRLLGVR